MSDLDFSKIDLTCFSTEDGTKTSSCQEKIEYTPNYAELSIFFVIALILTLVVTLFIRKMNVLSKIKSNLRVVSAVFSGWAIWCFAVFSYSQLFDERVDYLTWFTLPPVTILLAFLWWYFFVTTKK